MLFLGYLEDSFAAILFDDGERVQIHVKIYRTETAFTRCRHILKTVKNVTDRPPVHTKAAHFCGQILKTVDFENGTLSGTF